MDANAGLLKVKKTVDCIWKLMAHGDAWEGKWRGNWRMEWVASTLTLPRNVVYPELLPPMRTPRLPAVDWTDAPHRFKRTRLFWRKTKPGFCACAIIFQTQSTRQILDIGSVYCVCHIRLLLSNCSLFCTSSVSTRVWCSMCICKIKYSYLGITPIFTFHL